MKFLIVGLGSVGKRRIRNLKYLQSGIILGCDPHLGKRDEASQRYRITTFESFTQAMGQAPEAVIICPPSEYHLQYALEAAVAKMHFFTESCILDKGLKELISTAKKSNVVAAPSCLMRFYPGPKKIRKLLKEDKIIGQALTFTYQVNHFSPDQRPWAEGYLTMDQGRLLKMLKEIVFPELIWLSDLFGSLEDVSHYQGKRNSSESGVSEPNESFHLLLHFEKGLIGHLLVDILSHTPIRHIQIVGTEGNIEWDNNEQVVKIYSIEHGLWRTEPLIRGCVENMYINPEEPYVDEMRCFLEAILGVAPYPFSFEQAQAMMALLSGLKVNYQTFASVS